ncbi:hypothetical protein BGZ65_004780, partial [Modicella reniformis]
MRLEGSPLLDSSSSAGEGSAVGHQTQTQTQQTQGHHQRKEKGSKKPRASPSLGFAEARYFILKSLNDEDLKLSVQYGLWATQEHLVPILNEAYANSKDVYLVFSANKSGEFFGYARMMEQISVENESAMTSGKENDVWEASIDVPISPDMKAAMLDEVEKATKDGRVVTNEEAEVIARNSTTTKSWGIRFPVKWMCVHKVPFSKTSHMLNRLYENREVKVSKDGTEVDPIVGEQLLELFRKSKIQGRGRSASGQGSRSDSDGSRRSSIAGDSSTLTLAPPPSSSHRSPSSRRSSVMSTRSTGSAGGGGGRRASIDPSSSSSSSSRTQGPGYTKTMSSPLNVPNRGQFAGDCNPHSSGGGAGYR